MSQLAQELQEQGVLQLATGVNSLDDISRLEEVLEQAGSLFRVFLRHPLWKPLGVDLSRPPGRSGGVGVNSLHIDCVNMENPPPVVALHCLRNDPAGGGVSMLAPTSVLQDLPEPAKRVLVQSLFDEGQAFDLQNVGACLSRFSVLPEDPEGWVRWSGRLLEREYPTEAKEALHAAAQALTKETRTISLEPGETLVVDQRRFLHGRTALGNQTDVPPERRRLLVQCYIDPRREHHE